MGLPKMVGVSHKLDGNEIMNCSKGCTCKVRGGVLCVTVIRSLSQGVESTLVESILCESMVYATWCTKYFFAKLEEVATIEMVEDDKVDIL